MNATEDLITDSRGRDLLQSAADWRLIELLLSRPNLGWANDVAALARESHDSDLRRAAIRAADEASIGLYDTTFGPGGPAAPREVSHRQCLDAGAFLSETIAFYRAFGYRADSDEPPDHISVEAGFMGYLLLKQFYAHSAGDAERAAITAEAIERFSREHLATLAGPLARSLDHSGIEYLALTGQALLRRVGSPPEAAALDPDAGPLKVLSPDSSDSGCEFDD